jgi:hypothetical protein
VPDAPPSPAPTFPTRNRSLLDPILSPPPPPSGWHGERCSPKSHSQLQLITRRQWQIHASLSRTILSPYGGPTGTRGPAVSKYHTLLLASHQGTKSSQPASISVGRLPPLQAPVFRVLDSLLLSTDSTARALFVFRSIGWTDRLSFSVSGWKSGLVRLSVYGKLHYPSSVLCLVPRDRGYVQFADRKPVLPGRGCLLPCASGPVCCCRTRYACRWRVALVARSGTRCTRFLCWDS